MNIQEDEKKPVYEVLDSVTITKQHFDWLNWEVLRIGQLARQYADEGDLLRAELKLLRHERVHDLGLLGEAQAEVTILKSEADYFKTEVERLRASSFVTAVPSHQYERVIKAGDAMASSIQFNEEMAQDYNGPTIVHQSVQLWNAAKEGKQS